MSIHKLDMVNNTSKEVIINDELNYNEKEKTWDNPASAIVTDIVAIVPPIILDVIREMERVNGKHLEVGMYLKGECIDNTLIVSEEFYIPKQVVTGSTIVFDKHDTEGNNWNGVIHRHPSGIKNFSGVDRESINQNHMFSLLYVDNEISKGIVNLNLNIGGRVQLEVDVEIDYPRVVLPEGWKDKIEEHVHIIPRKLEKDLSPHDDLDYRGGPKSYNDDDFMKYLENEDFGIGL